MRIRKPTQTPRDTETPQVFAVEMKDGAAKFTRRDFLKAAGVATSAAALAGCAAQTPESTPTRFATETAVPTNTPFATPTQTLTPQPTLGQEGLKASCNEIDAHIGLITALAVDLEEKLLASSTPWFGTDIGQIKLWSLPENFLRKSWQAKEDGEILAFLPTRQQIASARKTGINIWSVPSGEKVASLIGHEFHVTSLASTMDGSILASGTRDGEIRLWSTENWSLLATIKGHINSVNVLSVSPDGALLISGCAANEQSVKLWSLPGGAPITRLDLHKGPINALATSPDGNLLASASSDRSIMLWSLPRAAWLNTLKGHTDAIRSLFFSADGKKLLSASDDKTLNVWSLPDGALIKTLYFECPPSPLAYLPASNILISTGRGGMGIQVWSLENWNWELKGCMFDMAANNSNVQGSIFSLTESGQTVEYTLPCGAPIPPGAICTCNCVAGTFCDCEGYTGGGGSHYWYPN